MLSVITSIPTHFRKCLFAIKIFISNCSTLDTLTTFFQGLWVDSHVSICELLRQAQECDPQIPLTSLRPSVLRHDTDGSVPFEVFRHSQRRWEGVVQGCYATDGIRRFFRPLSQWSNVQVHEIFSFCSFPILLRSFFQPMCLLLAGDASHCWILAHSDLYNSNTPWHLGLPSRWESEKLFSTDGQSLQQ